MHGHSSHHAKAIEVYRDKPILYGCGDFLNDYEGIKGYEAFRDDLVLMYFPRIERNSGRLLHFERRPLQIKNFRLHHASRKNVQWLRDLLFREGAVFGTSIRLEAPHRLLLEW